MSDMAVDTVPKKESSPKKATSPDEKGRKPLIVQLRGSEAFRAWVEKGADYDRSTVSVLVEKALIQYLKTSGFSEPPPRR